MSDIRKPNIVFILSDQHRYDWLGATGSSFVNTPNMGGLAQQGIRFARTYCNAPLCGPSRMSMLTGRHPYRNGVYINEHTLSSDVPTFVHALGLAGYHSVLCGRMHFMGADQRHGYNERLVGDICRCYAGGLAVDYGDMRGTPSNSKSAVNAAGPRDTPVLQYDRGVTEAFEKYVDQWDRTDTPLFATVGYYGPHHPYNVPEPFYSEARSRMEGRDSIVGAEEPPQHPWLAERAEKSGERDFAEERVREARYNYAGMISYLDGLVGRVLDAARKLPGETIVVYASDHGDTMGDHRLWGKCSFYEASMRVPLVISPLTEGAKLGCGAGVVVDHPTSLLDIAPTMVDLCGGPAMPLYDGNSLAPFIRGETVDESIWHQRPIYAELELLRRPPIRMVLQGNRKLCYYHTYDQVQLFDLSEDPDELHDVADVPAYAETRSWLHRAVLNDWDPDRMYADVQRKMDDLGYMTQWGRQVGMGPLEAWGAKLSQR